MRYMLSIWMACVLPAIASAAPFASDSFETYTAGADLNGNNGGTGFTGPWSANAVVDVVNASLSYQAGTVLVQGGTKAVQINGPLAGPTDNTFSRPFTAQSGPVYFSFLFRPVVNGGAAEDDFFQFMLNDDTDAENSGAIGMRNQTGTAGNDGYFVRIRNNTTDSNAEAAPNVLSVAGRTDFLVGKFSSVGPNYDRFDLWINPTSGIETAPNATLLFDSANNLIDFITLRTAFLDSGDQYQIDALTIGTQFSDVVSVVPEPDGMALWLLLGVGLVGFSCCRLGRK